MKRQPMVKLVAIGLTLAMSGLNLPFSAAAQASTLTGSILSATTEAPLVAGKLHVADPKTGRIYSSAPTGADGSFTVGDLPAATYELAVESDGGLYLVQSPLRLAPGVTRVVHVAVNPQQAPDPETAKRGSRAGRGSIWNNPLTAALLVVGTAVVVGFLINEATDDKDTSPSDR